MKYTLNIIQNKVLIQVAEYHDKATKKRKQKKSVCALLEFNKIL